jgi:addiction module RelB/DinJ family antitoxin
MPTPLDSDLVSFRVDAALRAKAAEVCKQLGLELHDVLRTLVARIARDGALPFAVGEAAPRPAAVPFGEYDARLWAPLKPQIDAEIAAALLMRFLADCSSRLDDASAGAPDPLEVARLTLMRENALRLHRTLDLTNPAVVARVIETYTPLVRANPDSGEG